MSRSGHRQPEVHVTADPPGAAATRLLAGAVHATVGRLRARGRPVVSGGHRLGARGRTSGSAWSAPRPTAPPRSRSSRRRLPTSCSSRPAAADAPRSCGRSAPMRPSARVVALGIAEEEADVLPLAEAGIAGWVTRDASVDELREAVASAAAGEARCSPRMTASLLRRVASLAEDRRRGHETPSPHPSPARDRGADRRGPLQQGDRAAALDRGRRP